MTKSDMPMVGIGIVIVNSEGQVLIGRRKGSHAPFYSIPGGHLGPGETFESAATREAKEETNLILENPKVIAVTNNLETYRNEGKHYVSIILLSKEFSGELKIMEPEKCDGWVWCNPENLPQPHFDASMLGIKCYLENKIYVGISDSNIHW